MARHGLTPPVVDDAIREGRCCACGPKAMTVAVILAGLVPIVWGSGTGSEVMSRIAAPMLGAWSRRRCCRCSW